MIKRLISVFVLFLLLSQSLAFASSFSNPYDSISEYKRDISRDSGIREINNYVQDVSSFIQSKCNGCENIIIVGSDYVVPQYRDVIGSNFENMGQNYIPTDSKFISYSSSDLIFSDLQRVLSGDFVSGSSSSKRVKVVAPDNWHKNSPKYVELRSSLENQEELSLVFSFYNSEDVSCDSFNKLGDATLFIIGDSSSNNLFSCYPEIDFDTEFMRIDRSLWSSEDEGAVLMSENSIGSFSSLINENGFEKLKGDTYIFHAFTEQVRAYVEEVPFLGPALNIVIFDTGSEVVELGDSCKYAVLDKNGRAGIHCTIGAAFLVADRYGGKTIPSEKLKKYTEDFMFKKLSLPPPEVLKKQRIIFYLEKMQGFEGFERIVDKVDKIHHYEGADTLMKNLFDNSKFYKEINEGFETEIDAIIHLEDKIEIKRISVPEKPYDGVDENMEIDILGKDNSIYEVKRQGDIRKYDSEGKITKKWGTRTKKIGEQVSKFKQYVDVYGEEGAKVYLVIKEPVSKDFEDFLVKEQRVELIKFGGDS